MKRFFAFTLTALLATACLLLTDLTAEWDSDGKSKNLGNKGSVYGYVYVSTGWEFPFATSYHDAYVSNHAEMAVKYYATFTATVEGPSEIEPRKVEPEGWVEMDGFGYEDEYFKFNMRGKKRGDYTITGESKLVVKADLNGDGDFDVAPGWDADCFTPFRR